MHGSQLIKCEACSSWFKIPFISHGFSLDVMICKTEPFSCPDCTYVNKRNIENGLIKEVLFDKETSKISTKPYKIDFGTKELEWYFTGINDNCTMADHIADDNTTTTTVNNYDINPLYFNTEYTTIVANCRNNIGIGVGTDWIGVNFFNNQQLGY